MAARPTTNSGENRPGRVTILFANNCWQLEVGKTVNVMINGTSAGKYTAVTSTAIEAVFATDKDEGPFEGLVAKDTQTFRLLWRVISRL